MKKTIFMMMVMVTMFAVMFTGCGKKDVNEYERQAHVVKEYMSENWGDNKDVFVVANNVGGDRWMIKYRFRIDGLKNDRWFNNWRIIEVANNEVVLINAYAD